MTNPEQPQAGFNKPQQANGYVTSLFVKHELGKTPSLADIEPVTKQLWDNPGTRIEAIELVLGRCVDTFEIIFTNPDLRMTYLTPDANEAFDALLLVKTTEELEAPQAQ